ncbi:hypothetical protein D3C78_1009960 [compost metagenome]
MLQLQAGEAGAQVVEAQTGARAVQALDGDLRVLGEGQQQLRRLPPAAEAQVGARLAQVEIVGTQARQAGLQAGVVELDP